MIWRYDNLRINLKKLAKLLRNGLQKLTTNSTTTNHHP